MKKLFSIIFALILMLCCVGCKDIKEDEKTSEINQLISIETQKSEAKNELLIGNLPEAEELSEEDKTVKAEIAKVVETKVDFRKDKHLKIQDKEYDIIFHGVKDIQEEKKCISYKNAMGDEFLYDALTGDLFLARVNSIVIEKNDKSVDINTAKKTAEQYISNVYQKNDLILTLSQEVSEGYLFVYSKYILGYKTNATFEIIIGFDNNIVYIRNATGWVDDFETKIDEALIEQKKQEIILSYSENQAIINQLRLCVENDTLYLVAEVSYGMKSDGTIGAHTAEVQLEIQKNENKTGEDILS